MYYINKIIGAFLNPLGVGMLLLILAIGIALLQRFRKPLEFKDFVPDPGALAFNASMFKEWIAYWGYRFLRK